MGRRWRGRWCRTSSGEAAGGRSDRLVAGGDRQLARARVCGGEKTGPSPVDRSRSGSKHHLIACGHGTPLSVALSAGNRNDITEMLPLVDAIAPVRGRRGPAGSGLGRERWVVERTIAWLHQYRPLRIRYERRADILQAFLAIGCSLICLKLLQAGEPFC